MLLKNGMKKTTKFACLITMINFIKKIFNFITASPSSKKSNIDQSKLGCGCIKDTTDERDYVKVATPDLTNFSSDAFSLLNFKTLPILNQGSTSACGGYSAAVAMNILLHKQKEYSKQNILIPNLSPTWIYYNARKLESNSSSVTDNGCQLRNIMKTLKNVGCISTGYMDYDYSINKTPPEVTDKAFKFKIHDYLRVTQTIDLMDNLFIEEVKSILKDEKLPIIVGVYLYNQQVNDLQSSGKYKELELSKINIFDSRIGGHALCMTGYKYDKDGKLWFECVNSWGENYGDNGLLWIDGNVINNAFYVIDMWTFDKNYF